MPVDPKKIKRRREALGLSQTEAAQRARFSLQRWNNIEAGRRLAIDPDALLAVARALKCRMEDLIKA
jgi:transcriptional regulator with XRE-family HTH domain